ncbi:MAG: DUF488 domain-containing protein [Nitrospinae bacterium]|nr:DUF488 domain-containing protein [Nitrospinota bacterium]
MPASIKRIYDKPAKDDGFRILVDRLWPRGLSKEKARVDLWLRDIAPSDSLRKWFAHDPRKWREFKVRYYRELENKQDLAATILEKARGNAITLLYAAKDEKFNNAVALKEYLEGRFR